MHKSLTKSITILTVVMLLLFSFVSTSFAMGYEPSAGAMIADTVLARPLGIVTTIGGAVMFAVSSPFSALGGNIKTAYIKLVKEPFAFSFNRPLGEF